jgi:activator-of-BECN1-regulated-autophagy protein 1
MHIGYLVNIPSCLVSLYNIVCSLTTANANVIVSCCKIHNDASCDLSADGTLLAAFVPSALGFPDDGMLAVYSLKKSSFGQCLFTKKFGKIIIDIDSNLDISCL